MEWGGARNIDVRGKYRSAASCMSSDQGSNPQPRYVPWPGIKLVTLSVYRTIAKTN